MYFVVEDVYWLFSVPHILIASACDVYSCTVDVHMYVHIATNR